MTRIPVSIPFLYILFSGTWYFFLLSSKTGEYFASNWYIAPTMVLGSFIAGSTAEGGGAVAFPVLTLLFHITPAVARDFTLMIQSVGMTAAACTIFYLKAPIDLRAIISAGIIAVPGIILGIDFVSTTLPPSMIKLFFVNWWVGFALALYFVSRGSNETRKGQADFRPMLAKVALVISAILGGIICGMTGSGLDIVVFSMLVLMLGLREDVATRSSVILMAWASLVGFAYKGATVGMEPAAWNFWLLAVPVVIVGAPFGAWFMKSKSPTFVRRLLYSIIALQFLTAFFVIPITPTNVWFSLGTVLSSIGFFYALRVGSLKSGLTSVQTSAAHRSV